MDKTSVYLLILKNKPMFKIGKADDVVSRMLTLKSNWGDFELENSVEIECSKGKSYKLEKTLHFIFSDYRIETDEKHDGHTEWFDISCFDKVLEILKTIKNENNDILNIIQGITPPPSLPRKTKRLSKAEREIMERKISLFLTKENENTTRTIIDMIEGLKGNIIYFYRKIYPSDEYEDIKIFFRSSENLEETIETMLDKGLLRLPGGGIRLIIKSSYATKRGIYSVSFSIFYYHRNRPEILPSYDIISKYFDALEKDMQIKESDREIIEKKYLDAFCDWIGQ